MCLVRSLVRVHLWPQVSQTNGFSPEWIRECVLRPPARANLLSHVSQTNVFSPEWTFILDVFRLHRSMAAGIADKSQMWPCKYSSRLPLFVNVRTQIPYENDLLSRCTNSQTFKLPTVVTCFPHSIQCESLSRRNTQEFFSSPRRIQLNSMALLQAFQTCFFAGFLQEDDSCGTATSPNSLHEP